MVSKRTIKIGAAGIAVSAVAIGLGVGLSKKNDRAEKQLSASQANAYCGRRLDGTGRLLSAPTNNVEGKKLRIEERKLGKNFMSCSGATETSFESNICGGSAMIEVSCPCSSVSSPSGSASYSWSYSETSMSGSSVPKGSSNGGSFTYNMSGSVPKGSSGGSAKGGSFTYNVNGSVPKGSSGGSSKGDSFTYNVSGSKSGSSSKSGNSFTSKSGSSAKSGSSFTASKSSGGSKPEGASVSGGSMWGSDGHKRDLQWGSDGHSAAASGGSAMVSSGSKSSSSGGSKSGGSKASFTSVSSSSKGGSGGSKGSVSKGSFTYNVSAGSSKGSASGSKASFTNVAVAGSSKGSKGSGVNASFNYKSNVQGSFTSKSSVTEGSCTCWVPAGSVPSVTGSSPIPLAPSICQSVTTTAPFGQNMVTPPSPTPPSPTPCGQTTFFFSSGQCTNAIYIEGGYSYESVYQCCEMNFGSYPSGCSFVDTCNPPPTTTVVVVPPPTTTVVVVPPPTPEYIITPSPPCESMTFYFSAGVCANSGTVMSGSTGPFATAEQCCDMNFGTGSMYISIDAGGCVYNDECNTPAPVPIPAVVAPTTPAPTPCEYNRFFFVDGQCTNDVFVADMVSYDSVGDCCDMNFGVGSFGDGTNMDNTDGMSGGTSGGSEGGCYYTDICNTLPPMTSLITPSPKTPAPTPCEAQLFFFTGSTCSNAVYIADSMSYSSVSDCCDASFAVGSYSNGRCNYVDECQTPMPTPPPVTSFVTPPPTEAVITPPPSPAPTPCDSLPFFYDGMKCSNEFPVAGAQSYDSVVSCCDDNFGVGTLISGGCTYMDLCSTLPPSPSPVVPISTIMPTFGSTPTVSTEVTGPPTVAGRGK